jgi:regulator of protease activity HflC (stomatin/prohibitin superfamily)
MRKVRRPKYHDGQEVGTPDSKGETLMPGFNPVSLFALLTIVVWLFNSLKVHREYKRRVVFRLGRLLPRAKGPGLIFEFWPIDKVVKVPLRTVTLDVPPQDIITRDNVSVKV